MSILKNKILPAYILGHQEGLANIDTENTPKHITEKEALLKEEVFKLFGLDVAGLFKVDITEQDNNVNVKVAYKDTHVCSVKSDDAKEALHKALSTTIKSVKEGYQTFMTVCDSYGKK